MGGGGLAAQVRTQLGSRGVTCVGHIGGYFCAVQLGASLGRRRVAGVGIMGGRGRAAQVRTQFESRGVTVWVALEVDVLADCEFGEVSVGWHEWISWLVEG
jgi:hypothetical protein